VRRLRTAAPGVDNGDYDEEETALSDKVDTGFQPVDWVTERGHCTVPIMYARLRKEIEEDVKKRNDLRPGLAPYEFVIEENKDGFSVVLKSEVLRKVVRFIFEQHAVLVYDDNDNQMFEVTVSFTEEGKCRINAKEQKCEMWQVRRMALEDLLFRGN
jgi:hypothetical protein